MSKVFALFVGIDRYHAAPPLHGSVADIGAMEALLTERIPPESLTLRTLRNDEATRAAIIDGFLSHLGEARANDIALFYFCGHGSQEPCPDEWRMLEPEGKNQTLVPVDARTGDVFDIADKELSALIHEVASKGPQVVVVTDSCHSGGNTRDDSDSSDQGDTARTAPASTMRPRALGDYLELARTLYDPARIAEHGRPEPRHVAIAACQSDQTAKEVPRGQPNTRGAFSTAFEHAVRSLGPSASYVDLVNAVRTKVRSQVADQLPSLHVSGGASGRDMFLGGHSGRRNLTLDADAAGRWWLSSGAIDGIPLPAEGVTEVAVYERGALDAGSPQSAPIASGIVDRVLEDRARLTVSGGGLDPSKQYVGAITRQGTPALNVVIDAAAAAPATASRVAARLAGSSAFFAVVDGAGAQSTAPSVTLVVSDESVQVRLNDGTTIAGLQCAVDDAGLDRLAQCCDHLARWYGLRDRAPAGSQVNGLVQIDLVPVAAGEKSAPADRAPLPTTDGAVVLQYDGDQPPRVQIRLRNTRLRDTSSFRLYVALLNLTETFECRKWFGDWIPGDGTALVASGRAIPIKITDAEARAATDYFQVVASLVQFDPERWTLPPLVQAEATRGDDEPEDEAIWGTTLLKVVTTR